MRHIHFFKGVLAILLMAGCQTAFSIPPVVERTPSGDALVSDAAAFKAALKTAEPGDVITWKNGTYENVALKMNVSGTEAAPITLRAETPGGVVFKGVSSIQLQGSHLVAEGFCFTGLDTSVKGSILTCAKGSDHCRFSRCKIDGTGSEPSEVDTKWVSLYGHDNEVSGCTFIDKRNMGCLLVVWMEDGIVPRHTIADNYFTRPYTHYTDGGKARNGQETIRIGTSDFSMNRAECTVRGNHFWRCHGERAEIISNKSCGNLFTGNLFEDSDGTLTLRHGNDCIVRGNWFLGSSRSDIGGVRIIGERHLVEQNVFLNLTGTGYKSALCVVRGESNAALNGYWTVKDAVVRDNWFVDCRSGITVNYSGRDTQDTPPQNLTVSGNTIVSSYSYMVAVEVIGGTQVNWEGNLLWGGSQKGISLPTVSQKPEVPDCTAQMQAVREKAGVKW